MIRLLFSRWYLSLDQKPWLTTVFYPSFFRSMFSGEEEERGGLVSAFNYRKKQQERRNAPAVVGRSGGRGEGQRGKGEEGRMRRAHRFHVEFRWISAASSAATDATLSYNKATRRKGTGGGRVGEERNGAGAFYAKICWILAKVADGIRVAVDFWSPKRRRDAGVTWI